TFGPGELSKTFTVPILDNPNVDGPRSFDLSLFNEAPSGSLGDIPDAIVNIIDDETLSEPSGSLDTAYDPNAGFNAAVHALALQEDGNLLVGGEFTQANGLNRRRMARLNPDGSIDQTFSSTSPLVGASGPVLAIVKQTDDRILLGGAFTNVNS